MKPSWKLYHNILANSLEAFLYKSKSMESSRGASCSRTSTMWSGRAGLAWAFLFVSLSAQVNIGHEFAAFLTHLAHATLCVTRASVDHLLCAPCTRPARALARARSARCLEASSIVYKFVIMIKLFTRNCDGDWASRFKSQHANPNTILYIS